VTAAQLLRDARERIATPERWTRGTYARTAAGNGCASYSPRAVCWCAIGTLERSSPGGGRTIDWNDDSPLSRAMGYLLEAIGQQKLHQWNDGRSHAEILAGFDRAIALAEGQEAQP
jgi:hypothetical protein